MKSFSIGLTLCAVILVSPGCAYRYSYTTGLPPSDEKITHWQNILGWGWGNAEAVRLDEISPNGVAEFGSYMSFTNWLFTFFTIGFYSPQTIYVIPPDMTESQIGGVVQ